MIRPSRPATLLCSRSLPPIGIPGDWKILTLLISTIISPRIPLPAIGQCHLWSIDVSEIKPFEGALYQLLDYDEQVRVGRFRREQNRLQFVASRACQRVITAGYLACAPQAVEISRICPRCGAAHGKPRLVSPESPVFSVAHSGARVLFAFGRDGALGVDVEVICSDLDPRELAARVLSPQERDAVLTGTLDEQRVRFFVVWVRKEAVVKAIGEGLTIPLRSFAVSAPCERAEVVSATPGSRVDRSLQLRDLQIDSPYTAALATTFPCTAVTPMDLSSVLRAVFS